MSKIHVMDEVLANKIAAGEVVEKCMNVVKELVENAIDANSSNIKIDLIDSGVKEIKVTDDGIGMDKEDAVLCFSRHATSKLKKTDDLFHINSLGFRGEALPSIASVSNLTLKTSNGSVGTEVVINGGKIESVESTDLIKGELSKIDALVHTTQRELEASIENTNHSVSVNRWIMVIGFIVVIALQLLYSWPFLFESF